MSQTLDQIYIANPSTTMTGTDLLYLVHSPYSPGTDSAILWSNLLASIFPAGGYLVWAANSSASISAAVGNGYILTHNSATTVTLPTTFAVGTLIGVAGQGAAWTIDIGASTNVQMTGNTYTTSIASANNTDTLVLIATVANTTWVPLSMVTHGFTAS